MPLVAKDKVIGLVDLVETRRERTFAHQEVEAATAICRVAAMAIDNADLYASLAATNRETEMLNAIAREAAASLDVGEIAARRDRTPASSSCPSRGRFMVLVDDDVSAGGVRRRGGAHVSDSLGGPSRRVPAAVARATPCVQRPVTVLHLPADNPLSPGPPRARRRRRQRSSWRSSSKASRRAASC